MTSLIEEALRQRLHTPQDSPAREFVVTPFEGTGVWPGIDLNDSAALLDAMER